MGLTTSHLIDDESTVSKCQLAAYFQGHQTEQTEQTEKKKYSDFFRRPVEIKVAQSSDGKVAHKKKIKRDRPHTTYLYTNPDTRLLTHYRATPKGERATHLHITKKQNNVCLNKKNSRRLTTLPKSYPKKLSRNSVSIRVYTRRNQSRLVQRR